MDLTYFVYLVADGEGTKVSHQAAQQVEHITKYAFFGDSEGQSLPQCWPYMEDESHPANCDAGGHSGRGFLGRLFIVYMHWDRHVDPKCQDVEHI